MLSTPWGAGRWGPLGGDGDMLFADFVGSRHNLQFDLRGAPGRFTSSRCGDGEPVDEGKRAGDDRPRLEETTSPTKM